MNWVSSGQDQYVGASCSYAYRAGSSGDSMRNPTEVPHYSLHPHAQTPIGHITNPRLLYQLMQGQLLENQGLKSKRPYRWSTRPRRGGAGWMRLSLLIDLQGGPPTMAITRHVRTKWQIYDQTLQLLRSILGFSLGSKVTTSTPLGQPFRHSFPESLFPENKWIIKPLALANRWRSLRFHGKCWPWGMES